jgi:hypothetical protein
MGTVKEKKRWWIPLLFLVTLVGISFAQTIKTRYYVVTSLDAVGDESVFSNQASCIFLAGKNHCVLTWGAPTTGPAATSYSVYVSGTSGGPYTTLATGITGTTYTDTVIPPNPPAGVTGVNN